MHKKILLIFLIFLLIGCKKIENNDNNYIELINDCLKKNSVTNEVSRGYKYYLPKGAKKLHDYDYNQIFKVDNNYIYLYVDVISYYHKKELIKADNSNPYYYQLEKSISLPINTLYLFWQQQIVHHQVNFLPDENFL